MTVKEAIERLKYDREMCYFNSSTGVAGEPYDDDCKEMAEALDIAINKEMAEALDIAIKILENESANSQSENRMIV